MEKRSSFSSHGLLNRLRARPPFRNAASNTRSAWGPAVCAFVLLPGTVAFLVPWLLLGFDGTHDSVDLAGLIPFLPGIAALLWCTWAFSSSGKGTLSPWNPPRSLVVTGLYRYSRNPMYIAVALILWGWAIGFHSWIIAAYALIVMLGFHLRVVFGEEPWLARVHGADWARYKGEVPRWLLL